MLMEANKVLSICTPGGQYVPTYNNYKFYNS